MCVKITNATKECAEILKRQQIEIVKVKLLKDIHSIYNMPYVNRNTNHL